MRGSGKHALRTAIGDHQCRLRLFERPIGPAPRIQRRPLYATGVGKVLPAFSPANVQKRYLRETKPVPLATRTLRTKAALLENLAQIHKDGIAVSIDEMADGGAAIAAPVLGTDGNVRAALVLAVPPARFVAHRKELEMLLRKGAQELCALGRSAEVSVAASGRGCVQMAVGDAARAKSGCFNTPEPFGIARSLVCPGGAS